MAKTVRNKPNRGIDGAVVTLFSLAAFTASELLGEQAGFRGTLGLLLFTLPATAYLFWRVRKPVRKIVYGSLLFGLGLGFFYEFMMQASGGYDVASVYLPRLFGLVPIDSLIAHLLMATLILTFYEHFIAPARPDTPASRTRYAMWLIAAMGAAAVLIHFVQPTLLAVPYPYAVFGTLAVVPIALKLYRQPAFASRLLMLQPYFFVTFMLFMIAAIHFGWWVYPAGTHYIGWVSLVTQVRFPFEELLFWMLLYAPAIVTYYEFFIVEKE